jgi:hypothetical protein
MRIAAPVHRLVNARGFNNQSVDQVVNHPDASSSRPIAT